MKKISIGSHNNYEDFFLLKSLQKMQKHKLEPVGHKELEPVELLDWTCSMQCWYSSNWPFVLFNDGPKILLQMDASFW